MTGPPAVGADIAAALMDIAAAGTEIPAALMDIAAAETDIAAAGTDVAAAGTEIPAALMDIAAAGTEIPAAVMGIPAAGADMPADRMIFYYINSKIYPSTTGFFSAGVLPLRSRAVRMLTFNSKPKRMMEVLMYIHAMKAISVPIEP